MEIKQNRKSSFYVCTLDPMSAVDMGDILSAIKKTIAVHNQNVSLDLQCAYIRNTKAMYKRISIKGRKPIDGKRTFFGDVRNKFTNARELDIYIHDDTSRTYNTRYKLGII